MQNGFSSNEGILLLHISVPMFKELVDSGIFDAATFLSLRIVEELDESSTDDDEIPENVKLTLKVSRRRHVQHCFTI